MSTINLSPAKPALEARELDALIDLYLQYSAAVVTPLTQTGYIYALSVFRDWWRAEGPRLEWCLRQADLTRCARDLESQARAHTGRPLSFETRRTIMHRLRQVLRWAHEGGYIERDYSPWVPAAEGQPNQHMPPEVNVMARLLRAAGESYHPARDKAILAVFIGTGIRRAECAALDVADVVFGIDGGTLDIRHGKGDKARIVVFDQTTAAFLRDHLRISGLQFGPLWRGRGNHRLTVKAIYDVVKNAARRGGVILSGPHDLRRLFATNWTRNRKGIGYTQPLSDQMGHSDAKMTLRYSLPDLDDRRDVFVSPFALIDVRGMTANT